jgi:hypothetical protein
LLLKERRANYKKESFKFQKSGSRSPPPRLTSMITPSCSMQRKREQ